MSIISIVPRAASSSQNSAFRIPRHSSELRPPRAIVYMGYIHQHVSGLEMKTAIFKVQQYDTHSTSHQGKTALHVTLPLDLQCTLTRG